MTVALLKNQSRRGCLLLVYSKRGDYHRDRLSRLIPVVLPSCCRFKERLAVERNDAEIRNINHNRQRNSCASRKRLELCTDADGEMND